mmetsp:Transcript_15040/g.36099  ORF Transcript_15040/g.36099 Transcript_15040/m.36099 type:complete len:224 (-) Transcript_15040:189-860(-)
MYPPNSTSQVRFHLYVFIALNEKTLAPTSRHFRSLKHVHILVPQHAHARIHSHRGEYHPQTIRHSHEQTNFRQRLALVPPIEQEGEHVHDRTVQDLPIHRQSDASHPQRGHHARPYDGDIHQQRGGYGRHAVPKVDEESERFPILVGRIVQRVRGPHLAKPDLVEETAERQRRGEVIDAGPPFVLPVWVPRAQLFVIPLDVVDVQAEADFAHGDEYVEIVEEY